MFKRKLLKFINFLMKVYIITMMGLVVYAIFVIIYILFNGIADLVIQI